MKGHHKILHLSDIHANNDRYALRFESMVAHIINKEDPAETIIIITGDIVENSFSFSSIQNVLETINLLKGKGFQVLIAPGNHDYGNGMLNNRETGERFLNTFELKFPKIEVIDNTLFVGLDSNIEEIHWYDRFFADGEIGPEQLEKLDKIINFSEFKNMKKVVYLHHHPIEFIPFHHLKDRHKLMKIVENKIDVMLYGHNHMHNDHSGSWGIKVMLDAGSSTGKRMFFRKIKHRVIDLADFSVEERNYL